MRLIFDIETNHKRLDRVSRCWCIAALDPETQQDYGFGPAQLLDGIRLLSRADELVGHNVLDYDLRVLERCYGFETRGKVIDTLLLSRLGSSGSIVGKDRGRHSGSRWRCENLRGCGSHGPCT